MSADGRGEGIDAVTRRRWLLIGAAALAAILVLVVGVLALRPVFMGSGPQDS